MKTETSDLLLPFYFGAIEESERTFIERELLSDSEALVDYLDLKREIECAEKIPAPSASVWARLKSRRRVLLPFSVGLAALAAMIVFSMIYFGRKHVGEIAPVQNSFSFDSSTELPASSSVL